MAGTPGGTNLQEIGVRLGYCAIIVGSVVLILNTLSYEAKDGAYPQVLLGLLVVLAAVGLYRSFAHPGLAQTTAAPTTAPVGETEHEAAEAVVASEEGEPQHGVVAFARTLGYVALTVLYAFAWNWVGTLLATLIFVAAVVPLLGERRIWLLLGVPIVLTALIYYVFRVVLYLPFPAGPLSP